MRLLFFFSRQGDDEGVEEDEVFLPFWIFFLSHVATPPLPLPGHSKRRAWCRKQEDALQSVKAATENDRGRKWEAGFKCPNYST